MNIFKKTKQVVTALLLTASLLASSQVFAAENTDFKPYIGMGVSSFFLDIGPQPTGVSGFSTKPSVLGYVVKAGLDYQEYFGIELRAGASGTASQSGTVLAVPTTMSVKIDTFVAYFLKARMSFDNDFGIYALAGGSNAKVSVKLNVLGVNVAASTNGSSFSFGAGATYDLGSNVSVEAEYMKYAADTAAATVFVSYHF